MPVTLDLVEPYASLRQWLVPGLLPYAELVFLDGATGVGKSIFCANLVASFTDKADEPDRPKLIYVSSSGQHMLRDHHLATQEASAGIVFDATFVPPFQFDHSRQDNPPVIPHLLTFLKEVIETHKPLLLVLDSIEDMLVNCVPLDYLAWYDFWHALRKLTLEHGTTIIVPRKQGLHEPRQYGPFAKSGTELVHFILTMHWHPIDPNKRIVSVARNITGPIGEQFHLSFSPTGLITFRVVPVYEHVRPAKSPQTWQPDPDHVYEHKQIADEIEKLMCNKPTRSTELKEAMKEQGYSARAVQRTLGLMKVECRNVEGIWTYMPAAEMGVREVYEAQTPANPERTRGAEVGAPMKLAV